MGAYRTTGSSVLFAQFGAPKRPEVLRRENRLRTAPSAMKERVGSSGRWTWTTGPHFRKLTANQQDSSGIALAHHLHLDLCRDPSPPQLHLHLAADLRDPPGLRGFPKATRPRPKIQIPTLHQCPHLGASKAGLGGGRGQGTFFAWERLPRASLRARTIRLPLISAVQAPIQGFVLFVGLACARAPSDQIFFPRLVTTAGCWHRHRSPQSLGSPTLAPEPLAF